MRDPRFSRDDVADAADVERKARLAAMVAWQSVQDWPRRHRDYLARCVVAGLGVVGIGLAFPLGLIGAAVVALYVVGHDRARVWWQQGSNAELARDRAALHQATALQNRALDALRRMDPDWLPLDE